MSPDHFSIIPVEKVAAVKAVLLQSFTHAAVSSISLLTGGLSGSSVYKILIDGRACILKLNPPLEANTPLSDTLLLAARAGVAPQLYYHNPQQGIAISDFIDSKPLRSVLKPEQLVADLAKKIKNIHDIPAHTKGTDLFATVDALISGFKNSDKLSGPIFEEGFQYYEALKNLYPCTEDNKVFSHNDLNPNNILCDGENIWIIDWDAASVNDRYIDLANAANYFVHTDEQERNFLYNYFDRQASDHEMACLYAMRQVCRIVYSMLMLQLAIKGKPADFEHSQEIDGTDMQTFGALMQAGKLSLSEYEGQLMYGKVLMNTAVQSMRSARFSTVLAQF